MRETVWNVVLQNGEVYFVSGRKAKNRQEAIDQASLEVGKPLPEDQIMYVVEEESEENN